MIQNFFQPLANPPKKSQFLEGTLGFKIATNKKIEPNSLVIFSIGNEFETLRKQFYSLNNHFENTGIVDLGVFKTSGTESNNLAGLKEVLIELYKLQAKTLILSNNSQIALAQWWAQKELSSSTDCALVAPSFSSPCIELMFETWKDKKEKKSLFHTSLIGHQSYFNKMNIYEELTDFFYDDLRLGEFRSNPHQVEALLREADFSCFDVNSIKNADFSSGTNPIPNGLYNEEACQITRYAGISNKINSLSLVEINPETLTQIDAMQLAQMMWYFADGIENRYHDFPNPESREFKIIRCPLENSPINEMLFLQSLVSGRLWIQVPFGKSVRWTGCTEDEFTIATQGEIPEKWFRAVGI